jgi:hypothetical protein
MVKQVLGNIDLELKADPGESFLIKDIFIYNPASNYITCRTEKTTTGYFRVGTQLGSHLPFPVQRTQHAHDWKGDTAITGTTLNHIAIKNAGGTNQVVGLGIYDVTSYDLKRVGDLSIALMPQSKTLLKFLLDLGIFKGFPVAEGEKFVITGAKQAGAIQVVVYEIYDAGDITSDMENGSKADTYLYLNYGDSGANINITGDTLLNNSKSPAEFPDFPFGVDVPAGKRIEILGVLASDFAPKENDGTNYCYTQYFKLVRGRKTLFDEDLNGILLNSGFTDALGDIDIVGEGQSLIGNYSDIDAKPPLIFPSPLVFEPGEELNVYLTTTRGGTGQNIDTDEQTVCFIQRVTPV